MKRRKIKGDRAKRPFDGKKSCPIYGSETASFTSGVTDMLNQQVSCIKNKKSGFVVNERPTKPFGFRRLDGLAQSPAIQIMEILSKENNMREFVNVANSPETNDDFLVRIVIILGKLARVEFDQLVVQLIQRIASSVFLNRVTCLIVKYVDEEIKQDDFEEVSAVFDSIAAFSHSIIKLLPTLAVEKLSPILKQCKLFLDANKNFDMPLVTELILLNIEKLNMEKEKRKKQPVKVTLEEEAVQLLSPPEEFRSLSTVPESKDLLRHHHHRTFLRPAVVQGPYRDVEHYLDVQFRLMREDFIRPLREGVLEYMNKKKEAVQASVWPRRIKVNNIKIYEEVNLGEAQIYEDKVGRIVHFDKKEKFCTTVNWDHSKRFMLGSLLLLTRDDFETILLAQVLHRNTSDLQKGKLLIEVLDEIRPQDDLTKIPNLLMAESNLFFGAYSHVLEALKRFDETNFPLKSYIVEARSEPELPSYLQRAATHTYRFPLPSQPEESIKLPTSPSNSVDEENFQLNDEFVENAFFINDNEDVERKEECLSADVLDNNMWPTASALSLDKSQFEAFKGALTNKVMLIQGPPGTGKTYLGLRIASVLLENSDFWRNPAGNSDHPMLVICYTNHALDQFLGGLTCRTSSIVRVGGGCKEESLTKFLIKNVKRGDYRRTPNLHSMISEFKHKLESLKIKYFSIKTTIDSIKRGDGILDFRSMSLFGAVPAHQLYSFGNIDDFLEWLEGDFQPKRLHRKCEGTLSRQILDGEIHGVSDLYFCIGFKEIDDVEAKDLRKHLNEKKSYLQNLLFSHNTDPKHLNINMVMRVRNLRTLNINQRWQLYRHWVVELLRILEDIAKLIEPDLIAACSNLKQGRMVEDQDLMSKCKVVGMTTSYAASHQSILKQLGPRIVIIEEAAEVLEAHVLVSLTDSVEHLIMIGDHFQLKPSAAVYELATKYRLNVSLFERLINNNVLCVSLTTQHRMRPDIARLICPSIYPDLINHRSVLEYPSIRGITQNIAFINHKHPQEEVEDIQSFRNTHEAKFVSGLVRYLCLQGYDAQKITVLTTYKGQMFYLYKLREQNNFLSDVRITVVDNYQGEENDIVLLSLVRSNEDNNVGFLKIQNRVCVALSRAKHGLYIFGNMDNLVSAGEIWSKVKDVLCDQNAFAEALQLKCEVHSTVTGVTCGDDFNLVPEGGCQRQCASMMPCGHICAQLCHVYDREHLTFRCYEPCERPVCEKNHICPDKCFMKCGPCTKPVSVLLPCNHEATIACHLKPSEYKCLEMINFTLPCDHNREVECYLMKTPLNIKCLEFCKFRIERCGHSCDKKCHIFEDPEHDQYKCRKPCAEKNLDCSADHLCQKACFEDCDLCNIMVLKTLPCRHKRTLKCHVVATSEICNQKCQVKNECGHICTKKCKDDCNPCLTNVVKVVPGCLHEQMMPCGMDASEFKSCTAKCDRVLPCGHRCTNRCKDPCVSKCITKVQYPHTASCGHAGIQVPCHLKDLLDPKDEELLNMCQEPCKTLLKPCEHRCKGKCSVCWQGRLHQACGERCGKVLVCGHSCKAPCADKCPPCGATCQVNCIHSTCPNICGQPCVPCQEPCLLKCQHKKCSLKCGQKCNIKACLEPCNKILPKCKHKCVGFCGDKCICEECNEGIREIFFGEEEEESARFILLPDCKHIFEASGLNRWLVQDQEIVDNGRAVIRGKVCPKCSTSINSLSRFNEITLRHAKDIQAVKQKVYGCVQDVSKAASRARDILSNHFSFPEELEDLNFLVNRIRQELKKVVNLPRKQRQWFSHKLSLPEVKSLLQYAIMLSDLKKLINKALQTPKSGTLCHQLKDKSKNEVINFIKAFSAKLRRHNVVRLSHQEAEDINNILKRLDLLIHLCFVESAPNFFCVLQSSLKEEISNVSEKVRGLYLPIALEYKRHLKVIEDAAKMVKVSITESEIRSVVSAMKMAQGQWFRCPNGHVYAIGECGGAMEEGQCIDCQAPIGGRSHQLRRDNFFAPEMDGATNPAYPTMANNVYQPHLQGAAARRPVHNVGRGGRGRGRGRGGGGRHRGVRGRD